MGEHTKIEWCDYTFNPWMGCAKVSAGCANCFAEARARRFGKRFSVRERTKPGTWRLPVRWNAAAGGNPKNTGGATASRRQAGSLRYASRRGRVFCGSLCDWLDDSVPVKWLADLLGVIAQTPFLDWLLLSKRPELWHKRMTLAQSLHPNCDPIQGMIDDWFSEKPPANVWIGATVENQEMADKRIPELLKIPAAARFLSCEPLLGAVDLGLGDAGLRTQDAGGRTLDWVIAGGESGGEARPMHPDWARGLRDQCAKAGVAFFFKQWGEWVPAIKEHGIEGYRMPDNGIMAGGNPACWIGNDGKTQFPYCRGLEEPIMAVARVGRKAAGRLLDGVEYSEFPKMENH